MDGYERQYLMRTLSFSGNHMGNNEPMEAPAHDPATFLAQKQKRIARQQIDQRNDRIKAWEDKRKRFK